MYDAIIVLGRGIRDDGTLPIDPQARVRKAVELYRDGRAPVIIMSGAWTYHFDIKPKWSEAKAMKAYAVELGVPGAAVIEESESKDTIGNVYFTKNRVVEPKGYTRICVVASDEHMPRIKYLFEKIYGPKYSFEFVESERVIDEESYRKEVAHEENSMTITRRWLDPIAAGDDAAIWKLMATRHPAYAPNPQATSGGAGDLYPDAP